MVFIVYVNLFKIRGEVKGMDLKSLSGEIRAGQFSSIYLFYGREEYLMENYIKGIENKLLAQEERDFNFNEYDLKETTIQEVIANAETFPFMCDKRIVLARNALFLTSSRVSSSVEHDLDAFIRYIHNPPEYTVLILVIPGEKPDERKKVVKELKKQGVCIDFQPLREGDLFSWIQREVKKNKVDIQTEAVTALLDLIGNDLRSIQQELSKMTLYVGEGGTITSEVVHLLASRHIDQNIFQLVEYAARKDIEKALREYYDLLLNKEEPIKILVLLARQFRILLQIKIMGDRGYSPQQITQSIGLKPFVFKKAYDQARFFTQKELVGILSDLAEEDYRIKSGQVDKNMAIEMFIMSLNTRRSDL